MQFYKFYRTYSITTDSLGNVYFFNFFKVSLKNYLPHKDKFWTEMENLSLLILPFVYIFFSLTDLVLTWNKKNKN